MSRPKIAVFIDWYLPGTKAGGPVRSVYSLIGLLKNDFDFCIITTNRDLGSSEEYTTVPANTLFVKDDISYYYFSPGHLRTGNMLSVIRQINPQLIYLNSFWSFHFSINIVRLSNSGLFSGPVLLAPRGMLGKGALGLKFLKKKVFLALAGSFGWYKNVQFHATQEQEQADIRDKFPKANIVIAPNINASPVVENTSGKQRNVVRLFYLSRIARVKNLHFAIDVLRSIPEGYEVTYDIFGNCEDVEYWKFCLDAIALLPNNIMVSYKGELTFNKVQETISRYHGLLMPTLNENFGHSIVESLLSGCMVIISDQTPWNDVQSEGAGYAIPLNNKAKFVDAVISLASMGPAEFSEKSKKANNYISKKIDLALIRDQYRNLFNVIVKN